ncbi:MAG: site-2 protease family protein [Candidatus Aenigmarchaeota archaeon]|nr:site-2 protease family protein [Candidatus Aenigmarchaeota archaeon]
MHVFSRTEIRDILVSLIVLVIVFSYPEILGNPLFFITSLLTVGLAFFGHELSHKFMARRYGFWSEYRMWTQGILLAVIFAIATNGSLIFAAPGAVYFASQFVFQTPRKRDIGIIGLSGPMFNIVLALILIGVWFVYPIGLIVYMIKINSWLALFNLIPFPPLDGSKIMAWNPKIWVLALIVPLIGFLFI